MERTIEAEDVRWRVRASSREALREAGDDWRLVLVRFEPLDAPHLPARQTWLRLEEDVPSESVLDQYENERLVEALMVAEEVED